MTESYGAIIGPNCKKLEGWDDHVIKSPKSSFMVDFFAPRLGPDCHKQKNNVGVQS